MKREIESIVNVNILLMLLISTLVVSLSVKLAMAAPTQNGILIWQDEIITPSNQKFIVQKMLDESGRELTFFIIS